MSLTKFFLFSGFCIFHTCAAGQDIFDWKLYKSTDFKAVFSKKPDLIYENFPVIGSIDISLADLEFRYFTPLHRFGIEGILYQTVQNGSDVKHSVFLIARRRINAANIVLIEKNRGYFLYRRTVQENNIVDRLLFEQIYNSKLLSIGSQKVLIDSLQNLGQKLNSAYHNNEQIWFDYPNGFNIAELKIGNRSRYFEVSQQAALLSKLNSKNEQFELFSQIFLALDKYILSFKTVN